MKRVIVGNTRAALWPKSKPGALNLNNLVVSTGQWALLQATAINDRGQIPANCYDGNGDEHALPLHPAK